MECKCGGHGTSSYQRYSTVSEAESAGFAVEKAPCVIALKDCPVCKRHSQDVLYEPGARGKVNLLQMMKSR